MNKDLLQTQVSFFLKKEFSAFEAFSLEIKKKNGEEGASQYFPIPIEAPVEFPRLTITYPNYDIIVFKNRINISCNEDFNNTILQSLISVIFDTMGLSIERLGFVKIFFAEGNASNLKGLISKEDIQNNLNLKEIGININITDTIEGFNCNNIEKISLGGVEKNGISKSGVIIMKDCNTIQGVSLSELNGKQALSLITAMNEKIKTFFLI